MAVLSPPPMSEHHNYSKVDLSKTTIGYLLVGQGSIIDCLRKNCIAIEAWGSLN